MYALTRLRAYDAARIRDSQPAGPTGVALVAAGVRAATGWRRARRPGPSDDARARQADTLRRLLREAWPAPSPPGPPARCGRSWRQRQHDAAVLIQAIRALTTLGDQASVPVLTKMVTDGRSPACCVTKR